VEIGAGGGGGVGFFTPKQGEVIQGIGFPRSFLRKIKGEGKKRALLM